MSVNKTLSISVLSGKGGVGKTNLALNLGYGLHESEQPVLLMDCDLGLANIDVLLGLTPEYTIQDIARQGMAPSSVVMPIAPGGFDFLPAATGISELTEMSEDTLRMLFKKLLPLIEPYNFLFLDLGAGIHDTVLSLAAMTHMRIVVVTPEPTAITDGYALMKVCNSRYGITDYHVLVNQTESEKELRQTFQRLSGACSKFLGFAPQLLGGVKYDTALIDAVRKQTPFLKNTPHSPGAKDIKALSGKLARKRDELMSVIALEALCLNRKKKE
jgi:flagellar biosynthesis protein FlhG